MLTAKQVKEQFKREGKTFSQWAAANNFCRTKTYLVLNGQCKALYGKGHDIAVALGMKEKVAA